jgi:Ca-activated chloride channel homolog
VDTVKIALHPERSVVRNDAISEVDLVVEVSCHPADNQVERSGPMNLCLVIDRSGSMAGGKLETAKKSCMDIFRRLGPGDLLTVVTFDENVDVIINPQTPRGQVEEKLGAVASGGMTNLSLGWYQGLLELQTHMDDSHYSRLFLLSDGQANRGETKRAVFSDTASRARDVGITASAIGIGDDFQEDLLEAIASSSGGRFWNISESDIEDIIEEEFEGALTVLLDRPRVAVGLPEGMRVSRELNNLRKVSNRYRLRPLQGEDVFNFAVRLEVDPDRVAGDRLTVDAALLDGERPISSTRRELSLGTPQEVAASPSHPLVRSTVQQFETTATDEVMLASLEAESVTELRQMLTAEIAKLQTMESEWKSLDPPAWGMSNSRQDLEVVHLAHEVVSKSVARVFLDMVEPYTTEPQVRVFFRKSRKRLMQEGQRVQMRRIRTTPWDSAAPFILEALALADDLISRHPDDANRLEQCREKLREYLEHD